MPKRVLEWLTQFPFIEILYIAILLFFWSTKTHWQKAKFCFHGNQFQIALEKSKVFRDHSIILYFYTIISKHWNRGSLLFSVKTGSNEIISITKTLISSKCEILVRNLCCSITSNLLLCLHVVKYSSLKFSSKPVNFSVEDPKKYFRFRLQYGPIRP